MEPAGVADPLWKLIVAEIREYYVPLVATLAILALVSKLLQSFLERWTTRSRAIKAVLDSAHRVYFKSAAQVTPEDLYQHRVTLFRAGKHWRDFPANPFTWRGWPSRQWRRSLQLFSRSGTAYQRSTIRLCIDDEHEEANQGVAGRAWFTDAQRTVSDLPEWPVPTPPNPANDPVCVEYASKGFMSVENAAKVRVKSRSICAHVVRTKSGERWGVLVLDSRDPKGVAATAERAAIVELSALLLTQLV